MSYKKNLLFILILIVFTANFFSAYANPKSRPVRKKWVIAAVSDGETIVDNGLSKIADEDTEAQKRKQIENQLGFLSHQLSGIPELPEIESLEGMPQIPDMKGKTFNYPGLQEASEAQK